MTADAEKEIDMELILDQALEALIKKRSSTKKEKELFKALLDKSPYKEKGRSKV